MRNNFFGFVSVEDFLKSLFGEFENIIKAVTVLTLGVITFLTNYIYEDASVIITLWGLYIFDFCTALILAYRRGNIVSRKIPRVALNLIASTLLISISWWMGRGLLPFRILPSMVIGVLYTTQFISIVENLTELEILPKSFSNVVKKRFRIGKISKQIKSTKEKE